MSTVSPTASRHVYEVADEDGADAIIAAIEEMAGIAER
jgi:hypothetical protein